MGIKHLNSYLLKNISVKSIYNINIENCKNKKIVIDTSIYLYKFVKDNALEENLNKMIGLFKQNNIIPIFVFDGKPPIEKRDLLIQRRNNKKDAELQYNILLSQTRKYSTDTSSIDQSIDGSIVIDNVLINNKLEYLKSQMTKITYDDINNAKSIILKNDLQIIEAEQESDIICAKMVINNEAWACLSDDMDMFVYGCPRVIRLLNVNDESALYYDLNEILLELNMSLQTFREIMILSGTDYNINMTNNMTNSTINNNANLYETLKWYYKFKSYLRNIQNDNQFITKLSFYDWLLKNTSYIKNYTNLLKINKMFII
jgi:5'-3' exonuclease